LNLKIGVTAFLELGNLRITQFLEDLRLELQEKINLDTGAYDFWDWKIKNDESAYDFYCEL
jgi:hypothetical protein